METLLDELWIKIVVFFQFMAEGVSLLLSPLEPLGPTFIITFLGIVTVLFTKLMNRLIITKRFTQLEKEFHKWLELREEAIKGADHEKGKRLARNIDQAQLNRAYYDYFFEGLLLGLARKVIPIFFVFAYINEYYRGEELSRLFGRGYLFAFTGTSGEPVQVGAVFYYFVVLIMTYLAWSTIKKIIGRKTVNSGQNLRPVTVDTA